MKRCRLKRKSPDLVKEASVPNAAAKPKRKDSRPSFKKRKKKLVAPTTAEKSVEVTAATAAVVEKTSEQKKDVRPSAKYRPSKKAEKEIQTDCTLIGARNSVEILDRLIGQASTD